MGIKFLDIEGEKMKAEKEQKDLVGIYIRINSQDTKEILYFGIECANRKTELISLDSELNKDKFLNDKLTNEIEEIEY